MTADFGPCSDWPVYWTCDVSTYSPEVTGYAVATATRTLWALSGRRFGTCEITLRPKLDRHRESLGYRDYLQWSGWDSWPGPGYAGGYWLPFACIDPNNIPELALPGPVNSVTSVTVDGSVLPASAYRLDDSRTLVRTDGRRWPRHQNMTKADTEPGTWSVTALYGLDVPESARLAMGELACEILRASSGEDCRLPAGVTNLARQGVTIQFPDVGELLKNGRTGLYLVDLFLTAENPHGLKNRSRTYSVDGPRLRRAES